MTSPSRKELEERVRAEAQALSHPVDGPPPLSRYTALVRSLALAEAVEAVEKAPRPFRGAPHSDVVKFRNDVLAALTALQAEGK